MENKLPISASAVSGDALGRNRKSRAVYSSVRDAVL